MVFWSPILYLGMLLDSCDGSPAVCIAISFHKGEVQYRSNLCYKFRASLTHVAFSVLLLAAGGSRSDMPPSMQKLEPDEAETAPVKKPRAFRKERVQPVKAAAAPPGMPQTRV